MARDRAIQLAVEGGETPPTLRLYRWARPTVTLGRFQSPDSVDLAVARSLGVDVVRRATGGRGVLHDDELTYAVVARTRDGVPRGVAASYRYLSAPLAEAYRLLGVGAEVTERDHRSSSTAACYLATTRADLSLGALKLSGSAQVWSGETVLQHGSFTISRDAGREARIFELSPQQAARLAAETATIESATGARVAPERIGACVVEAFRRILGVDFREGTLTVDELKAASALEDEMRVEALDELTEQQMTAQGDPARR